MADTTEIAKETEEEAEEKTARAWLPEWTPAVLVWAARILLALSTAFVLVVILMAEITLVDLLPWWMLLVIYSAHFGALLRLSRDAKKGAEYARHSWKSYVRWANSLT
ncbi:hypothetical protein D7231_34520 [Streptomyces klenkii]|uniref:Uncharacterized protein n=1 Tax=Streptomyces klenkii TaxID=1420899 RepID=A0A3B0ABR6_9ACTN|nr:hypothetical protein [Streptomyces klenkii]RKN56947.1 hypothetical protein D7231_34520 [Streptomyces klenkii]